MQRCILAYVQYQASMESQIVGCNRLHDVEARLARWLMIVSDRVGGPVLKLTQEFLAQDDRQPANDGHCSSGGNPGSRAYPLLTGNGAHPRPCRTGRRRAASVMQSPASSSRACTRSRVRRSVSSEGLTPMVFLANLKGLARCLATLPGSQGRKIRPGSSFPVHLAKASLVLPRASVRWRLIVAALRKHDCDHPPPRAMRSGTAKRSWLISMP